MALKYQLRIASSYKYEKGKPEIRNNKYTIRLENRNDANGFFQPPKTKPFSNRKVETLKNIKDKLALLNRNSKYYLN